MATSENPDTVVETGETMGKQACISGISRKVVLKSFRKATVTSGSQSQACVQVTVSKTGESRGINSPINNITISQLSIVISTLLATYSDKAAFRDIRKKSKRNSSQHMMVVRKRQSTVKSLRDMDRTVPTLPTILSPLVYLID